jgi:peptide/nickel transport system permease protein
VEITSNAALVNNKTKSNEWRRIIRVFSRRKLAVIGLMIIMALIVVAIFAPLIAPYDPSETDPINKLQNPSWQHFLGTDQVGRDVFSRIVYGSRISLLIGLAAVTISAMIGITMGLCAAYFGGWTYSIIMRITDTLMIIPGMILIVLISGLVGGGIGVVIIALTVNSIGMKCRVMCGTALSTMQNEYILASRTIGVGNLRLMFRHVLLNSFAPMLVMITMNFGTTILSEAGLSFLGIGIMPPSPAWGFMVNEGRSYLLDHPILSLAPGFAVMLVVFGFNMMGDGLRDALDPRLRGSI